MTHYFYYPLIAIVVSIALGALSPEGSVRRKACVGIGNFALMILTVYVLMYLFTLGYRDIVVPLLG